MCICVMAAHISVHVCRCAVCAVSVKARKRSQIPWDRVCTSIWVLGLELGLKEEQTVL